MKQYVSVGKSTSWYPSLSVGATGRGVMSRAGPIVPIGAAGGIGLTTGPVEGLGPRRKPLPKHDPGRVIRDVAMAIVVGGDCLADLAPPRDQAQVFISVGSDLGRLPAGLLPWPRRNRGVGHPVTARQRWGQQGRRPD